MKNDANKNLMLFEEANESKKDKNLNTFKRMAMVLSGLSKKDKKYKLKYKNQTNPA